MCVNHKYTAHHFCLLTTVFYLLLISSLLSDDVVFIPCSNVPMHLHSELSATIFLWRYIHFTWCVCVWRREFYLFISTYFAWISYDVPLFSVCVYFRHHILSQQFAFYFVRKHCVHSSNYGATCVIIVCRVMIFCCLQAFVIILFLFVIILSERTHKRVSLALSVCVREIL